MDSDIIINLILLIVLLALSAFFSSSETALTAVSRIRIETLAKEDGPLKKKAKRVLKVTDDKQKMLSAILIGNNLVNILATALATATAISLFGSAGVGIATGILTILVLTFGEIAPKSIATLEATNLSLRVAGIILFLMWIFTPLINVLNLVVKVIKRIFGVSRDEEESGMTTEELKTVVSISHEAGEIEEGEKEYIVNVFDFADSTVKEVMTPRIDFNVIKREATYEEMLAVFSENKYTRYPVCGENNDDIVGIFNVKDVILCEDKENFCISDHMRKPMFTFEQKNTADLFDEMRQGSIAMAIVLDEYGALAGLVTLEDLLEELVGEIRDEYDEYEEDDITPVSDVPGAYDVLGRANLEDLCKELSLNFVSEDYDTVGGYLMGLFEHFPEVGEEYVTKEGIILTVIAVDNHRIEKIRIIIPNTDF